MENRKEKIHTLRTNLSTIGWIGQFLSKEPLTAKNAELLKYYGDQIGQMLDKCFPIIEEMDSALDKVKVLPSIFDEVMKIDKENRESKRGIYSK